MSAENAPGLDEIKVKKVGLAIVVGTPRPPVVHPAQEPEFVVYPSTSIEAIADDYMEEDDSSEDPYNDSRLIDN